MSALAQLGLIDEYRLMVFPTVLGAGRRLFAGEIDAQPLRLVDFKAAGECLILVYEPRDGEDSSAGS